jgi:plastocyanin
MRRAAILVPVLLLLAVAGCGGDDDSGGSSSAETSTQKTTPASGGGAASGGVEITMKDIQFAPKTATVKVGQQVTWVNEDSVPHNAKADSGASFKSDDFGQGGKFTFTPTKAGTIQYECTLHPGMTGTLTVTG